MVRLYCVSFNTNGAELDEAVVTTLLGTAGKAADLVIAAFQEYDLPPAQAVPPEPRVHADDPGAATTIGDGVTGTEAFMRVRSADAEAFAAADCARMACVLKVLGPEFRVVADVAMGEPAGTTELPSTSDAGNEGSTSTKSVEWHGFCRLIVIAHQTTLGQLTARACVVPCGCKHSSGVGGDYPENSSPDKGAVAVLLTGSGSDSLLVVGAHLAATNSREFPEQHFDEMRLEHLEKIQLAATTLLTPAQSKVEAVLASAAAADPSEVPAEGAGASDSSAPAEPKAGLEGSFPTPRMGLVVLGDLNFRVETSEDIADKARGGKEFTTVVERLSSVEGKKQLFAQHERLHQHLTGGAAPAMLHGCHDCMACLQNGDLPAPTFPFPLNAPHPRQYETRRAPSWTDRVLWRQLVRWEAEDAAAMQTCEVLKQVVCSDHEPVVVELQSDLLLNPTIVVPADDASSLRCDTGTQMGLSESCKCS